MKVSFTVVDGPGLGTSREFTTPGSYMIGRAQDMDYRRPEDDPYVSRRHAIIEVAPPSARMKDLQSSNPPHLNGRLAREADLRDGDELELGLTRFRVRIDCVIVRRTGSCRGCGAAVPLLGDESAPARCPACPPKAPSFAGVVRACHACGTDLSGRANADGRAADLGADVLYCCEDCLPETDEHKNRRFGTYRAVRRLGGGGMGDVFLVHHAETARLLAAKEMNKIAVGELALRFDRESQYMRECRHPSLVRYVDNGVGEDGNPYLVMQYMPDGTFDDLLDRQTSPLSPAEGVPKILSVLEGLMYFHTMGMIHRDIKPGNILLDFRREDRVGCARLADFGLAYNFARAGTVRFTRRGIGMGSPLFMAPEQARNASGADARADIYSVGVTLYYALSNHFSLDFPTASQILRHVREHPELWPRINPAKPDPVLLAEEASFLATRMLLDPEIRPVPIRERRPDLPAKLASIVDRSVQKEIGGRFGSAAEMRDALAAAIA